MVKRFFQHLFSHWPAHLAWVFPVVALAIPSLRAYESAHPNALASQIIGIVLTVLARYHAPTVGKAAAIFFALVLTGTSATAQAPTPSSSTVNFQIGASAFGMAPTSDATPASDVTLSLNPGFKKLSGFSFASDNLLAPGANLQYYGGGVSYEFQNLFPRTSALAPLSLYVRGTVGADRIVPSSGPGQSHVGFMAGVGLGWAPSGSVRIQLLEVDDGHFPGAPWGANAPMISGGLALFFGKGTSPSAARRTHSSMPYSAGQ